MSNTTEADRYISIHVLLEKEFRDEDLDSIINAISVIRGVASVGYGVKADSTYWAAKEKARLELEDKIWNALIDQDPKNP